MTKERSGFVVTYGPSENVPAALAGTFAALKTEMDLAGLEAPAFATRLAYYYSELDAIHAFREGNSRTLGPLHPTCPKRRAISSTGLEQHPRRSIARIFVTLAMWPSCAGIPLTSLGSSPPICAPPESDRTPLGTKVGVTCFPAHATIGLPLNYFSPLKEFIFPCRKSLEPCLLSGNAPR